MIYDLFQTSSKKLIENCLVEEYYGFSEIPLESVFNYIKS